jgi:hypothetical protein
VNGIGTILMNPLYFTPHRQSIKVIRKVEPIKQSNKNSLKYKKNNLYCKGKIIDFYI